MIFLARIVGALGAILLLTSPGFAPIGARTVDRGVDAHPALWVVKDDDTTIYLFGTIHVLKPGVRWLDGPIQKAFNSADTLRLEVLTPDRAQVAATTARLAVDTSGTPLTDRLDPATRARYLKLLGELGINKDFLQPFQPWFAAVTLSVLPLEKLGYSAESGVEDNLKAAATEHGKQLEAFETMEEQLGFFAGLPRDVQLRFLSAAIDDAPKAKEEIGKMVANWSTGHPDELAREMNESLTKMPELANALLIQRNKRWAEWIAKRLDQPGTVFVAVGAGHLAGKGSVLEELKARHLRVQRIDKGR